MIAHTPDTLTLRRYAKFEKSRDPRDLMRVPVPAWVARKRLNAFTEAFNKLFNTRFDDDLEREKARLLSLNKIYIMQALLQGILAHLVDKAQLDLMRGKADAGEDKALMQYLAAAKEICDFDIKELDDVKAFREELERRMDKYSELFQGKEQKQGSGVSIMQLAFSVFSLVNLPFDGSLTLSEFAELKTLADERAKKMQESIQKSRP